MGTRRMGHSGYNFGPILTNPFISRRPIFPLYGRPFGYELMKKTNNPSKCLE